MRLKKHTNVLLMMAITSLWGCAPTEEEKRLAEEEELNKPSLSIQPVGPLVEPDDTSLLTTATVIMSKTVDDNVTVQYTLNSNTATAGADFQAQSGILTIPSGSNSASIDLTILADEFDEQNEEFTIVLSSPVKAKLGIASEVVVIQDSALDVTPVVSIEPVGSLTEPDSGSTTFSAIVKLSSFSSFPVTVDYSLDSDSATLGSDFEASSGTLSFEPGTNSAEIELVINEDNIDEFDENFTITLSNPINAQIVDTTATVTIIDSDEDTTTMSFSTDSARVAESSGEYKVKLVLTHASEKNINIPFTTAGLATKDQDYIILTPSPIQVPLNTNEVDVVFNFVADNILEGGESLILQLGSPDNAELGESNTFTFTIASDVTLNDTGVITWYDGSNFASEVRPVNSFPGQDADFGHDIDANEDLDGADAFSFTNLDAAGEPTSDTSEARCVQDNRTGLVFELKQEQQILPTNIGDDLKKELEADLLSYKDAHVNWQAANFTYYWLNTDETTNGGDIGEQGITFDTVNAEYPVSSICAFPYKGMLDHNTEYDSCNTQVYTAAINDFGLCGFTDWKLPTIEQLRSIHNYRDITLPINGTEFFPNNVSGDYISATPSADGAKTAWCISSDTGRVGLCKKNTPSYVRMVRGGAQ